MVSLRKLAELAGVSHMTVWSALHDKPGVSSEARQRILTLASEYHYHPNRLVDGLITGKTRTIGHITENSTWHFHARVCSGIINAASHNQVHVMILNRQGPATKAHLPLLISELIEQRVEGIIIFCGSIPVPTQSVLEMWSHDIVPVLICDSLSEKPLDHIDTDERQLVQLAVDYLMYLGHKRIAYCGLETRCLRNQEMHRAFRMRGLSLDYFIEMACMTAPDPEKTEGHLDRFFRHPSPPTAVICFEDQMATQLLLHALRRGLRVPGDLSILGCSNLHLCGYLTPALTSIEQFPEEMGRQAYELIYRRQHEGEEPGARKAELRLVSPKLVIRESCGPPAPYRPAYFPSPGVANTHPPSLPSSNGSTAQDTAHGAAAIARLLRVCSGEHSKQDLMARLGLRHGEYFRTAFLLPALAAGYLERTIPEKPRSGKQRYRVTAKGQAWMRERVKGEE